IFYFYLQREVPKLKLKKLSIPDDREILNISLRARFDDVLKYDYEQIFEKSIFDNFEFSDSYLPSLKRNIEELNNLDFKEINADIIGSIYNMLIDNQEQHDRGQHFTNTNEVDIICGFCINEKNHFILDSGCGAGTFLVRAYYFLKYFHPEYKHQELLERLWGIDIAPFPAFLAMMNLSLLNIASDENYPAIIQKDFAEIKSTSRLKMINLDVTHELKIKSLNKKYKSVKVPVFDSCIGNPPYIRQEIIQNKKAWAELARKEFDIPKINRQSDLYVYYLMHTSAFLNRNGRLGYVISGSWLDVNFGAGLQKFLLDNFKIITIIDNQKARSFETASINTVILIIERCDSEKERQNNMIRFIRIFQRYEDLIGSMNDEDRIEKVFNLVNELEKPSDNEKNVVFHLLLKNQGELKEESTFNEKYENGHWGAKYLRAPAIYNRMISNGNGRFIPLKSVCDIWRGFTTGANEFFYMKDDSEKLKVMPDEETLFYLGNKIADKDKFFAKYGWFYSDLMKRHYVLERQFFKPLFKTQKEANKLDVDLSRLKYVVLICNYPKKRLKSFKYKILEYISDAEAHELAPQNRPSCAARISADGSSDWYMLGNSITVGDFIFPSKIGEKFRLIDNRNSQVYVDKVNYNFIVKDEYKQYSNHIFLYLNSITFRYFIDLFSRQLTGSQTLSDVDVNLVQKTNIIKPELLDSKRDEINELYFSIKDREQGTIFEEVQQEDKRKTDEVILDLMGLNTSDLDELYQEACQYIKFRQAKSESIRTSKIKGKLNYTDALKLVKLRFDDIRKYNDLVKDMDCKEYKSYNLRVKFPPNYKSNIDNFFENKIFVNFIIDDKQKYTLVFDNAEQVCLFEYLVKIVDVREM
ncbi:MAG: type restriction enzyme protein, partial [Bacteroidota bacterium]|nr:type restriction enzyme protein [Bacteroidota bacterium]